MSQLELCKMRGYPDLLDLLNRNRYYTIIGFPDEVTAQIPALQTVPLKASSILART